MHQTTYRGVLSLPTLLFFSLISGNRDVLALSSSPTPSPSPASLFALPPACNPALQPYDLHSTSGVITLGWKDHYTPPPRSRALGQQQGEDWEGGGGGEGGGEEDDGSLLASPSASHTPPVTPSKTPSPSRGAHPSQTPSRSHTASTTSTAEPRAPTQLPPGTTCQWVIDGGVGMAVELTWGWVRAGGAETTNTQGAPPPFSPCTSSGAFLGVLASSGGTASGGGGVGGGSSSSSSSTSTVLDSLCYYTPSSTSPPRVFHSNASSVTVDFIIDDAATLSALSPPPPTLITGFSLSYRVYDPSIPNADCEYGPWGEWGPCSSTCGGGVKVRHRSIVKQASGTGTCKHKVTDDVPCAMVSCQPSPDVPCTLSNWTAWSACSPAHGKPCGPGSKTRSQSVLAPASGKGSPCPATVADLTQHSNCDIPCIAPGCGGGSGSGSSSVPKSGIITPGAYPQGVFGVGSPPRKALPPGAPPSLATLPPHYPGNTACGWSVQPVDWPTATTSTTAPALPTLGKGEGYAVNVTLWWVDLPGRAPSACTQGNTLKASVAGSSTGSGSGGGVDVLAYAHQISPSPKLVSLDTFLCGQSGGGLMGDPFPITLVFPPGFTAQLSLVSGEAPQTGLFSGFGASWVVGVGRIPATLPTPPSPQHTTAILSLTLPPPSPSSGVWGAVAGASKEHLAALELGVRGDLAVALSVPLYRIAWATVVGGSSSSSSGSGGKVTVCIIAGAKGESPTPLSTTDLLMALVNQARDGSSPLHTLTHTGGLNWGGFLAQSPTPVLWSTPATAVLNPAQGVFLTVSGGGGDTPTVTHVLIENRGGSPLIVYSAALVFPPSSRPGNSRLSVTPDTGSGGGTTGGSFPITVPPTGQGPSVSLTLTLSPGPPEEDIFAILKVTHSDPEGQSVLPIEVSWGGAGGGGVGAGSITGAGVAVGGGVTLLTLCLLIVCVRAATVRNSDGNTVCDRFAGLLSGGGGGGAGGNGGSGGAGGKRTPSSPSSSSAITSPGKVSLEVVDEDSESAGLTGGGGGGGGGKGVVDTSSIAVSSAGEEAGRKSTPSHFGSGAAATSSSSSSSSTSTFSPSGLFGGLALGSAAAPSSASSSTITPIRSNTPLGGEGSGVHPPTTSSSTTTTSSSSSSFSRPLPPSGNSRSSFVYMPRLQPRPQLRVGTFEAKWASLPTVEVWGGTLTNEPGAGVLESALKPLGIACMASGNKGGTTKYYFYGCSMDSGGGGDSKDGEGGAGSGGGEGVAIVELCMTPPSLRLSGVIKASSPELGTVFLEVLKEGLGEAGLLVKSGASI